MRARRVIEALEPEPATPTGGVNPFPGSKVPAIVWHGTDQHFRRFSLKHSTQGLIWFSSDRSAVETGGKGGRTGVVLGLWVDLKQPAGWEEYHRLGLWELKREGFDGALLPDPDGQFDGFVFSPKQIRVASRSTSPPKVDEAEPL